jgi:hypothetical protein
MADRHATDPARVGRRLAAGVGREGRSCCGGLGTRLREHSDTVPKSLVSIGNRPIRPRSSPKIVSSILLTGAGGMASSLSSLPVSLPARRTAAIGGNNRLLNGDRSSI